MTNADGEVRPATPPPAPMGYPGYAQPEYGAPYGSPGYDPPPPYPGYGPPPYPGYGPPPYPSYGPGYPPQSYPPQSYPPHSYPPHSYPPSGYPAALKPGVIPLRPLTLAEIFNGAVAYIRANPKATLGFTAIVVVVTQIIALILEVAPLAANGSLAPQQVGPLAEVAPAGSALAGVIASGLSAILLSGMLTVVVGRAVFGGTIGIGEAWQKVRGRLLALIGLALLEGVALGVLVAVAVFVIAAVASTSPAAAWLVGTLLVIGLIAALAYVITVLSFAPVAVVLERLPVFASIARSFALVRGSFWRVFGIRLLALVVTVVVANAVAIPFVFAGELLSIGTSSTGALVVALALRSVGSAIGQIITAPFSAGVVVLLYTDRRIRAEAFDLVLQTGAPVQSTDDLWLTRHR